MLSKHARTASQILTALVGCRKPKLLFRILAGGGLGDIVLLTPTLRQLKKLYPDSKIKVLCFSKQATEILRHNPNISVLKTFNSISAPIDFLRFELHARKNPAIPHPAFRYIGYLSLLPNLFQMGDGASLIGEMIGISLVDPQPEVFLTQEEQKKAKLFLSPYRISIVIQANATLSRNKNWSEDRWSDLVCRNPDYKFIQLGVSSEPKINGAIDLRGKTSVRESLAILKSATAFVGIESFLGHAAAAVGTPGVVLFGPSALHVANHSSNIAVTGTLPHCAPCLDLLRGDPCPYERKCMLGISVEQVDYALRLQVNRSMASRS